ncbi:MAG: hypothetical protein ACRC9L_01745 [Brevinema sp.]
MPASENNTPRVSYKFILALLSTALLLWLSPFVFIIFNDKSLAILEKELPQYDVIQGTEGEMLRDNLKSPYAIVFSSENQNYAPYQSIPLTLALSDKKTGKIASNLLPTVRVYKEDGSPMPDIYNRTIIPLQFNSIQKLYSADFLPGDSTYQGRITAKFEVQYSAFSVPIHQNLFLWINNPKPSYTLPIASIFLGLESKEPVSQRRILAPNNKEALFSSIHEWMPLLNVDAVILQGAFSKTYGVNDNEIWDEEKISESESIAGLLSQRNIKTGLIVQMMELDGMDISRLDYLETKNNTSGSGQAERSIVSLNDAKRPRDIIQMLTRLQNNNNLTFVGLSKMFVGESYNEELRDLFNRITRNIPTDDAMFRRWKEYKAVGVLRDILSSVEGSKPYFMMLSHNDLLENPAVLQMTLSAGVSFVILDVKVSTSERQAVMDFLNTVVAPYRDRVVFSLQIDYNDFAEGEGSPIDGWKNDTLMWSRLGDYRGLYINDLYKAMFGRRGSYPAFEWMLGIATTTSTFKKRAEEMPVSQKIVTSTRYTTDVYSLFFDLENTGKQDVTNLSITLMPTVDFTGSNMFRLITIPSLKRGQVIRTNIVLSNIMLKPNVLQQKYRFLSFHTEYTVDAKTVHHTDFISFEDPNAEADRPYQNVVVTNRPVLPIPAPPAPPVVEEKPADPPAAPAKPAPAKPAAPPRRAPKQEVKPTNAPEVEPVEPKKMSFAERQRQRRLERQREKEAAK